MPSVCLYLHAHQPFRLRRFSVFDIGAARSYFDEEKNRHYLSRIVRKSYLPTNRILLDLIKETKGRFKVSFSLSGVLLEQLEASFPEVIESFQKLVQTGCVELLGETYYHSLAYLFSEREFIAQVKQQQKNLSRLFAFQPVVFRNTELMFNSPMAILAENIGYQAILAEGADHILGWRSPNFVYQSRGANKIKLLLRNYRLSDDIAFRFSSRDWSSWPLTAEKFTSWLNQLNGAAQVVNLFMDYETFGEHQWEETGIFNFLKALPQQVLAGPANDFQTPREVVKLYKQRGELDFPQIVSWADTERDLSAWLGNQMQRSALEKLYSLETAVKEKGSPELLDDWRKLQTSDHFYHMCTKWFADGDVHKYFNPYESPYEAFITFMNIFNDLQMRLSQKKF